MVMCHPVGISVLCTVIEVHVCGNESVSIVRVR